jgi:hypothetical protein
MICLQVPPSRSCRSVTRTHRELEWRLTHAGPTAKHQDGQSRTRTASPAGRRPGLPRHRPPPARRPGHGRAQLEAAAPPRAGPRAARGRPRLGGGVRLGRADNLKEGASESVPSRKGLPSRGQAPGWGRPVAALLDDGLYPCVGGGASVRVHAASAWRLKKASKRRQKGLEKA